MQIEWTSVTLRSRFLECAYMYMDMYIYMSMYMDMYKCTWWPFHWSVRKFAVVSNALLPQTNTVSKNSHHRTLHAPAHRLLLNWNWTKIKSIDKIRLSIKTAIDLNPWLCENWRYGRDNKRPPFRVMRQHAVIRLHGRGGRVQKVINIILLGHMDIA